MINLHKIEEFPGIPDNIKLIALGWLKQRETKLTYSISKKEITIPSDYLGRPIPLLRANYPGWVNYAKRNGFTVSDFNNQTMIITP